MQDINNKLADVLDINNKLADVLEKLTDFFEHYSDESVEYKQLLTDISVKQNIIIGLLTDIKNK